MKRIVWIILVSLLLIVSVSAGGADENNAPGGDLKVKLDKMEGLYGYVDGPGNWAVGPRFDHAAAFSDGVAVVTTEESGGKAGYIRPDGTFLIEPRFDSAFDFADGFAVVADKSYGNAGVIDKSGKLVLETKYYYVPPTVGWGKGIRAVLSDKSMASTERKKYGAITSDNRVIAPEFDGPPAMDGALIAFYINDETKNIQKQQHIFFYPDGKRIAYTGEEMGRSEGVRRINFGVDAGPGGNGDSRFGYMMEDGRIIDKYVLRDGTEYPFAAARDFSEGIAAVAVKLVPGMSPAERWGYVRKDGTWLVEPNANNESSFVRAGSFKDGLAPVKVQFDRWWGYIDKTGVMVIKPEHMSPEDIDPRFAGIIGVHYYTQEEYEATVKKAEEACSRIIKDSMSDYDKLKAIYKYILDNVEYSLGLMFFRDSPTVLYGAYGALVEGHTVCQGYAESLSLMLTIAGIENDIVVGYANSNQDGVFGAHAWNLVKIDGTYYHADATWDDNDGPYKPYFLVSDELLLSQGRVWNPDNYPEAPKSYGK